MAAQAPLVVTTRSRLRGRRHVRLMHAATARVLRELDVTPGAERVVSLVAGQREFWSVSVWTTRHAMQEFMRSGAHGAYLWEVGRWLESFWLMRWRPTERELGSWGGRTLAPVPAPDSPPGALDPATRERILAAIPTLAQAYGPSGAPTYDSAPEVRWDRELLAGASGVLLRAPTQARALRRTLLTVHDEARADADLLRVVHGRAHRRAGSYLLGLWAGHDGPARTIERLADRLAGHAEADALWACELAPEHEFGRWDDLRVRDRALLGTLDPAPTDGPDAGGRG